MRRFPRFRQVSGKKRRGTQVVEFAIVAPIFILLVFGMIEFGRMVMVQQVLTNASREGARQATLDGADATQVENAVDNYLTASSIADAAIGITPTPLSDAEFGDPITVTVSVDFADVSWIPSPFYLSGTTLSASTVMRRETIQ